MSTFDVNYDFMQSRYNMNEQISYNKMKCHIKNKQVAYTQKILGLKKMIPHNRKTSLTKSGIKSSHNLFFPKYVNHVVL